MDGLRGNHPCSNHVMGGPLDDDAGEGQSLFADGSVGRKYADIVWRREESIPLSSAGDHLHIERPKHFCMGLVHKTGLLEPAIT